MFGANVALEGDRFITAPFNLANAVAGKWAVVVRNPDGQAVTAKVKLKNVAATDAVGAIEVAFEAWGQKVSLQHRGGLGTGEEVMLSTPLKARAGNDGELRGGGPRECGC